LGDDFGVKTTTESSSLQPETDSLAITTEYRPFRSRTTRVKPVLATVLVLHGVIHLAGFAKAFGWADMNQLTKSISKPLGVVWLIAGCAVLSTAAASFANVRRWWVLGAFAAIVSQVVIVTSWIDARVGTVANVVLLVAVVHGYLSTGPQSMRAEYERRAARELARPPMNGLVSEDDLAGLPDPIASYVQQSGAVGQPRVYNFGARWHGKIRSGPDATWMPFVAEQVNRLGPKPSRLFFMDATMKGLPIDVLHAFVGPSATMRVKLWSLIKMVDASGREMDRAETVTLFNDLCVLAPAALIDPSITWEQIDRHTVRGVFTAAHHTVSAALSFNDAGELIDFISDDRLAASADGKTFTPRQWSTPVSQYRWVGPRRVSSHGEARWHASAAGAEFVYVIMDLEGIQYNVRGPTA
jgi:hypothetical protein